VPPGGGGRGGPPAEDCPPEVSRKRRGKVSILLGDYWRRAQKSGKYNGGEIKEVPVGVDFGDLGWRASGGSPHADPAGPLEFL